MKIIRKLLSMFQRKQKHSDYDKPHSLEIGETKMIAPFKKSSCVGIKQDENGTHIVT
jgi:hypothetical protein